MNLHSYYRIINDIIYPKYQIMNNMYSFVIRIYNVINKYVLSKHTSNDLVDILAMIWLIF